MRAPAKTAQAGLAALVAETPLTPQPPALVLFGRDGGGKPHAAWFDVADTRAATDAAALMRLRVLPLTDAAGRELATQLVRGRVLPGGRALVPLAKRELYDRLVALAGEGSDAPAAADAASTATSGKDGPSGEGQASPPARDEAPADAPPTPPTPPAPRPGAHLFVGEPRPRDRDEIGLGSVVLAHEGPEEGWWEAEIIGANGRTFSLRWCDYPTQPTILRKAGELALLPPGEP